MPKAPLVLTPIHFIQDVKKYEVASNHVHNLQKVL